MSANIPQNVMNMTRYIKEEGLGEFLNFYIKNREYWSVKEGKSRYPESIWRSIADNWNKIPNEVKKTDVHKIIAYNDAANIASKDISWFNNRYGSDYPKVVPYYKDMALNQLEYVKEHFRNKDEFLKAADELMSLPDNPKIVFEALHNQNIYNLRYIPNKIALVDEFCNDININIKERDLFVYNNDLTFSDIVNFDDKKSNFSKSNYAKAMDKMVSILSNDANGGNKFRKAFLAISYFDYTDYSSDDYNDLNYESESANASDSNTDTDTVSVDEDIYDFMPNFEIEKNYCDKYNMKEGDAHLAALYITNLSALNRGAIALSKIMGAQATALIDEYLKVNKVKIKTDNEEEQIESSQKILVDENIHDEIEALMADDKNLNASQLHGFSYVNSYDRSKAGETLYQSKYRPEKFIHSVQVQKDVLKFCSSLPADLTSIKSKSFAKFLLTKFFYKQKDGARKTRNLDELKIISAKWNQLSATQENLKYNEILSLCRGNEYINGRKDAFEDAFKISMGSSNDKYFDMAQSCYLRGINTPRTIEFEEPVTSGVITLQLMAIDDPEVLMVSNRYNICCQHIAGTGKYSAISSAEDPFSRAMLIKENDRPIGISWLWTNEEKIGDKNYTSMCIDNVELREFASNHGSITSAIKEISQKIADSNGFHRVTIGAHSKFYDAAKNFYAADVLALPANYGKYDRDENIDGKLDYNDSFDQCNVYVNPNARPINLNDEVEIYIADRDNYTLTQSERLDMNNVAAESYPNGWQNVSMAKKDPKFKLLYDKNKNLMGYVSFSDNERNIYDMAVRPQFRGYSKYLINSLKAHGAELGGSWTADARDSTSFRLLKLFAARGDIRIEELPSYQNINGETLHRVKMDMTEAGVAKSTAEKNSEQRISALKGRLKGEHKNASDKPLKAKDTKTSGKLCVSSEHTL